MKINRIHSSGVYLSAKIAASHAIYERFQFISFKLELNQQNLCNLCTEIILHWWMNGHRSTNALNKNNTTWKLKHMLKWQIRNVLLQLVGFLLVGFTSVQKFLIWTIFSIRNETDKIVLTETVLSLVEAVKALFSAENQFPFFAISLASLVSPQISLKYVRNKGNK